MKGGETPSVQWCRDKPGLWFSGSSRDYSQKHLSEEAKGRQQQPPMQDVCDGGTSASATVSLDQRSSTDPNSRLLFFKCRRNKEGRFPGNVGEKLYPPYARVPCDLRPSNGTQCIVDALHPSRQQLAIFFGSPHLSRVLGLGCLPFNCRQGSLLTQHVSIIGRPSSRQRSQCKAAMPAMLFSFSYDGQYSFISSSPMLNFLCSES